MVCFNTELFGDEQLKIYKKIKKYSTLKFSGLLTFEDSVRDNTNVYLWNKLFRTDLVKKYNIKFPENLYEDITFSKTYSLLVDKVYFDPRAFHHYRVHSESILAKAYKSDEKTLHYFKNWNEILNIVVLDKDFFIKTKDVLEKWYWDYYFNTKSLLKTTVSLELEDLKTEYFKNFNKFIELYN